MNRIITADAPVQMPDVAELLRAVIHLDQCLARGVVIGLYEDSLEVSDEDITKALKAVRHEIDLTATSMARLAAMLTQKGPFAQRLQ